MTSFKEVVEFIKEGIAPAQCVGCGGFGSWLCEDCRAEIVWVKQQHCYKCGKLSAYGKTCNNCRRVSKLTALAVACYFDVGPIRTAIHAVKYGGVYELAPILAGAFLAVVPEGVMGKSDWVVVPVPMTPARFKERGYNQAELMARDLADKLDLVILGGLLKIRVTEPQATLPRAQRLINLRGSMEAMGELAGLKVILVDDVATTGATLEECARALREAGVKRVCGVVIARA